MKPPTPRRMPDQRWRSDPAGRQLLGTMTSPEPPGLRRPRSRDPGLAGSLMELIRTEGQGKRAQARWLSFGINGLGAALMVVVFSMTAGLTGLEIGVAGGTAVVGSDCWRRFSARTPCAASPEQRAKTSPPMPEPAAGGGAAFPGPARVRRRGAGAVLAGHAAALSQLAASA